MCKQSLRPFAAIVALASMLMPSLAAACTITFPAEIRWQEEPDHRSQCRAAWRERDTLIEDLRSGARDFGPYWHIVTSLRDGSKNCRQRSDFAFAMVDAAIGSPVRSNVADWPIQLFFQWKPHGTPASRIEEVAIGSWLLGRAAQGYEGSNGSCGVSAYSLDYTPEGVSPARIRAMLVQEHYWNQAHDQFGNNPGRDRLFLQELIDPNSDRHNLNLAAELAPKFYARDRLRGRLPILLDVAEAITDPAQTPPDYEGAARILDWYTPRSQPNIDEPINARADALWVRVWQTRLSDPDPQVSLAARLALLRRDPNANANAILEESLGLDTNVTVLDSWPETLPALREDNRIIHRITDNYPTRAMRRHLGGRVELGIVFGPNGAFHSTVILRSAGDVLDRAAIRNVERYFRPRVKQLMLTGFEGEYVYVPLPAFEYWLRDSVPEGRQPGLQDDVITIIEPLRLD